MNRWRGVALLLTMGLGACASKNDAGSDAATPPPADVAAPPADALKTPSGLASKMLRVGFGRDRPGPHSHVLVNYTGWTPDGKMFDTSLTTGGPVPLDVDGVIAGWSEGLQLMVTGEKRRFWIPGRLAYDSLDMPGAPKGPLVFDIELLEVR
jgi:FKBP-type peptidyl-prolyl cis-trans isomerase